MKLVRRKHIPLFFFLTIVVGYRCAHKEPEEKSILPAIQQTGQLITAEYTLQKMVKASDNKTWYKIGDRSILISVQAIVKAGIDLQRVTKEDVVVHDSTIRLQLPPPTIFSVSLPPDQIKLQYQDVSFFRSQFSAAEREALLRQAESQVRQLADSLGILATAKANATTFLQRLLQGKGFKQVIVEYKG
jgi:hypothetical protein